MPYWLRTTLALLVLAVFMVISCGFMIGVASEIGPTDWRGWIVHLTVIGLVVVVGAVLSVRRK